MATQNPAIMMLVVYSMLCFALYNMPQTQNEALLKGTILEKVILDNTQTGINASTSENYVTGIEGIGQMSNGQQTNNTGEFPGNAFNSNAVGTAGSFVFFNPIFMIFGWIIAIFNFITMPLIVLKVIGLPPLMAQLIGIPTVILYAYGVARIFGAGQ